MPLNRGNVARNLDTEETEENTAPQEGGTSDVAEEEDVPSNEEATYDEQGASVDEVEAPEPEPEPTRNTRQSNREVATRQTSAPAAVNPETSLENEGFEGLDFGFGAFPIIKLDDGEFVSNDTELGTDFTCFVMSTKPKFVYKTKTSKDADTEVVYTYDQEVTTKGEPISDIVDDWKQAGLKYDIKKYLDVIVEMASENELQGQVCILSIPPTSVPRLSGFLAQLGMRGHNIKDTPVKCSKGRKVTRVQFPFFPWSFERDRDYS